MIEEPGDKIRRLRRAAGLSQAQLAEKIGVSNFTVSAWENNKYPPTGARLNALAEVFGINSYELMGLQIRPSEGNESPQNQDGRYFFPEEALELPEGSLSSVEEAERQLKAIPQARLVAVDLYLDQILPILHRLNRAGKMELIKRADELSRLPEYQKEG